MSRNAGFGARIQPLLSSSLSNPVAPQRIPINAQQQHSAALKICRAIRLLSFRRSAAKRSLKLAAENGLLDLDKGTLTGAADCPASTRKLGLFLWEWCYYSIFRAASHSSASVSGTNGQRSSSLHAYVSRVFIGNFDVMKCALLSCITTNDPDEEGRIHLSPGNDVDGSSRRIEPCILIRKTLFEALSVVIAMLFIGKIIVPGLTMSSTAISARSKAEAERQGPSSVLQTTKCVMVALRMLFAVSSPNLVMMVAKASSTTCNPHVFASTIHAVLLKPCVHLASAPIIKRYSPYIPMSSKILFFLSLTSSNQTEALTSICSIFTLLCDYIRAQSNKLMVTTNNKDSSSNLSNSILADTVSVAYNTIITNLIAAGSVIHSSDPLSLDVTIAAQSTVLALYTKCFLTIPLLPLPSEVVFKDPSDVDAQNSNSAGYASVLQYNISIREYIRILCERVLQKALIDIYFPHRYVFKSCASPSGSPKIKPFEFYSYVRFLKDLSGNSTSTPSVVASTKFVVVNILSFLAHFMIRCDRTIVKLSKYHYNKNLENTATTEHLIDNIKAISPAYTAAHLCLAKSIDHLCWSGPLIVSPSTASDSNTLFDLCASIAGEANLLRSLSILWKVQGSGTTGDTVLMPLAALLFRGATSAQKRFSSEIVLNGTTVNMFQLESTAELLNNESKRHKGFSSKERYLYLQSLIASFTDVWDDSHTFDFEIASSYTTQTPRLRAWLPTLLFCHILAVKNGMWEIIYAFASPSLPERVFRTINNTNTSNNSENIPGSMLFAFWNYCCVPLLPLLFAYNTAVDAGIRRTSQSTRDTAMTDLPMYTHHLSGSVEFCRSLFGCDEVGTSALPKGANIAILRAIHITFGFFSCFFSHILMTIDDVNFCQQTSLSSADVVSPLLNPMPQSGEELRFIVVNLNRLLFTSIMHTYCPSKGFFSASTDNDDGSFRRDVFCLRRDLRRCIRQVMDRAARLTYFIPKGHIGGCRDDDKKAKHFIQELFSRSEKEKRYLRISASTFWLVDHEIKEKKQFEELLEASKKAISSSITSSCDSKVVDFHLDQKATHFLWLMPHAVPFNYRITFLRQMILEDRVAYHLTDKKLGITIQRRSLYNDAFTLVIRLVKKNSVNDGQLKGSSLLRARWHIKFIDTLTKSSEAGIDAGGVFKEFLEMIIKHAFDPSYGLFSVVGGEDDVVGSRASSVGVELYPNPHAAAMFGASDSASGGIEELHLHYRFLGILVGKAIYEGIVLNLQFAQFFLNNLLGNGNSLDDLAIVDPQTHRGLMQLKEMENISDACLYFCLEDTVMGQIVVIDLIPEGRNIPVTNENIIKYIHLVAYQRLVKSGQQYTQSFLKGLGDVLDVQKWLCIFNAVELQQLIKGTSSKLDVGDLKRNCKLVGGYTFECRTLNILWEVLEEFSPEDQGLFLQFCTGSSRPPLLGFASMSPPFSIRRADDGGSGGRNGGSFLNVVIDIDRLPSASTCFNLLKLPPYMNKKNLCDKLLQSIRAGAGFDLS